MVRRSNRLPKHDRLRRECERALLEPGLRAGDRFCGFRELMHTKGVSQATVERALRPLLEQRVIEPRGRSGFYVSEGIAEWRARREPARIRRIALVLPFWCANTGFAMPTRMLRGLCSEAGDRRWRVEIVQDEIGDGRDAGFVDRICETGVDAVAWIQPREFHLPNLARLRDRGMAVVTTGRAFAGLDASCVRFDAACVAQQVSAWAAQVGAGRIGVLGGSFDDLYYGEYYAALLALPGGLVERARIAPIYGTPGEAAATNAFQHQHRDLRAWLYLATDCLFHVLPPAHRLGANGLDPAARSRQHLYHDLGAEAAGGIWPYPNVHRLATDFEAMGRQVLHALENPAQRAWSVPCTLAAGASQGI